MISVIGSLALERFNLIDRKPKDFDLVGTYGDLSSYIKRFNPEVIYPISDGKKLFAKLPTGDIIEAEIAWDGSTSSSLLELIGSDPNSFHFGKLVYPSLNVLYMLKMSHRYLKDSPHFLKTMRDIHLMRKHGAVIQPEHKEFYKARIKATYDYGHPKLNVSKNGFFRDNDIYVYEHDDIHRIVAHLEKPAYEYYKPDTNEVFTSKEMFFSVDETTRLYGVIEEVMVLALERCIIPNDYKPAPKVAFLKALEKTATSITSGWFREFCWENYDKIVSMYDPTYVERFKDAVDHGRISPIVK